MYILCDAPKVNLPHQVLPIISAATLAIAQYNGHATCSDIADYVPLIETAVHAISANVAVDFDPVSQHITMRYPPVTGTRCLLTAFPVSDLI